MALWLGGGGAAILAVLCLVTGVYWLWLRYRRGYSPVGVVAPVIGEMPPVVGATSPDRMSVVIEMNDIGQGTTPNGSPLPWLVSI